MKVNPLKVKYLVQIDQPRSHRVKVSLEGHFDFKQGQKVLCCYFPFIFNPGGHLANTGRFLCFFKAQTELGHFLYHRQIRTGVIEVWPMEENFSQMASFINLTYEIYCWSSSLAESHVDEIHAFLNGASYLMGVRGWENREIELRLQFPPIWSKVSTTLQDISLKREEFLYFSPNFSKLMQTPIAIGCHETNGFSWEKKDHEVGVDLNENGDGDEDKEGEQLALTLKNDLEKVAKEALPFFQLSSTSYFLKSKQLFLLRLNDTEAKLEGVGHPTTVIMQSSLTSLLKKEHYKRFMAIMAEFYLQGPLCQKRGLWPLRALARFLANGFLWKANIISEADLIGIFQQNLEKYGRAPGKRFATIEEIEGKEDQVFFWPEAMEEHDFNYSLPRGPALHLFALLFFSLLVRKGGNLRTFLMEHKNQRSIWKNLGEVAKDRRKKVTSLPWDETWPFFMAAENVLGPEERDLLEGFARTTEVLDWNPLLENAGLEMVWEECPRPWVGALWSEKQGILRIESVELDSPAFSAGLCRNDEIAGMNGNPMTSDQFLSAFASLPPNQQRITLLVVRHRKKISLNLEVKSHPRILKELKIKDRPQWEKFCLNSYSF